MSSENYLTERHLRLPDGTFPHLGVADGEVAPYVLMAGSPDRVEQISEKMDEISISRHKRGYSVYTGMYKGQPVSAATSGLGAPSVAIAIEELGAAGGGTFIRVGSCASIQENIPVGGIVIATGSVRDDRAGDYYAPGIYPAVADFKTTQMLCRQTEERKLPYHIGVIRSTDSFYEGERNADIIDCWRTKQVLAFEMESGTAFTVARVLGYRAATILVPGSNLITGECTYKGEQISEYKNGIEEIITVSLEAVAALSKGESGQIQCPNLLGR